MKEYIERSKEFVQGAVDCCSPHTPIAIKVKLYLEQQPAADVVEVVRCGNCKFCVTHKAVPHCIKAFAQPEVGLMDFCSYGERKNNHEQTD